MYRKMMHRSFNPTAAQMYWDIQEHEARILVDNIAKSPEDLLQHLRRYSISISPCGLRATKNVPRNAAAVIMKLTYGYPVTRNDDHFVALAEEHLRLGSVARAPGKWLVDSFPSRKRD